VFSTAADNQSQVGIKVFQGEREIAAHAPRPDRGMEHHGRERGGGAPMPHPLPALRISEINLFSSRTVYFIP